MFPITEIFSSTPSLIPASQLQHPLAQTRRDRLPRPVRKLLVDVCHLPRRLRLPHSRRPRRGLVHRGGGDLPDLRLLLALEHSLGHLRDVRQTRPRPERTALFRRDVRAQSHGVLQLHPRRDAVAHRPDERVPGSRRVHHRRFLQLHRRREDDLHRPERRGRLVARVRQRDRVGDHGPRGDRHAPPGHTGGHTDRRVLLESRHNVGQGLGPRRALPG
mmetsp:Transcript_13471/g.52931  ORF Transcript_13471/g.52931 Transcript_13471/m.52931 type:complete len:217 (-) Transcript_13471:945-1595(-)